MRFPIQVSMDGRNYTVKAVRVLKTGERMAVATVQHAVLGKCNVKSPSVLLRLARRVEEIETTRQS